MKRADFTQEKCEQFQPHQRERIAGSLKALLGNLVGLRKAKTRLFPYNLSAAVFVHLVEDPSSGMPRTLGMLAVDEMGNRMDAAFWTIISGSDMPSVRQSFSERILKVWKASIARGKGPHIFFFGDRIRQGILEWGELAGDADRSSFLWREERFHCTDLRRLLEDHFDFPAPGRLTLFAAGWVLGLLPGEGATGATRIEPPESLFHDDFNPYITQEAWTQDERLREEAVHRVESILDLQAGIWKWARRHLESDIEQTQWEDRLESDDSSSAYLHFLEEEKRLREEDILSLQEYSLEERIERFRALGPLTFEGTSLDEEGRFLYDFRVSPGNSLSKFREDDFLRLAPLGSSDLQSGFPVILVRYNQGGERLSVLSRLGRLAMSKRLAYSLEEDLTDWNHPKLVHVAQTVLGAQRKHPVQNALSGSWTMSFERERLHWARNWLRTFDPVSSLNPAQRAALELPFLKRMSLIEGPPGTGKTHLLGWIIIAIILHAQQTGEPLRIAVSALTHRAIDGVLRKVARLASEHHIKDFPARVLKCGRWTEDPALKAYPGEIPPDSESVRVERLESAEEIRQSRYLVLGSTGFGLYNLLEGQTGTFPQLFDWIIFDEASQVLVPQALLSLVYGRGNFLFLGDVKQLPPVVLGRYGRPVDERPTPLLNPDSSSAPASGSHDTHDVHKSILEHLLDRYGAEHRVRLDVSYRMNENLCAFPSRMWYDGALRPAHGNAHSRLDLHSVPDRSPAIEEAPGNHALLDEVLDPEKPVVLVLTDHKGCHQKSDLEKEVAAQLACRLLTTHGLNPDRLAIVSPHRAQNNATAQRLRELLGANSAALPVIDTVERLQGAERDVIIFSMTTSDPDSMMSGFSNNPNRFNVAITRAKSKLIVVGSRAFFLAVPQDEESLRANRCFKEFLRFCREKNSLFVWKGLSTR